VQVEGEVHYRQKFRVELQRTQVLLTVPFAERKATDAQDVQVNESLRATQLRQN
jgi:hypothetical protein